MRKLFLLLLIISFKSFGQTLETDRLALVAIYNQSGGPTWLSNWVVPGNPGDNPCGWDGVTCAGGRVTRLSIMNNGLGGSIPSEIGNLTELTHLYLATEYFGPGYFGSVPSEMSNLTKLEYLNILGNFFDASGLSVIGSITSLKELHMNIYDGVPASFANLVNIEKCVMGRFGPLEGVGEVAFPNVVCQWPKIKVLRMGGVVFNTQIPSQIGNLATLDTLELTGASPYGASVSVTGGTIPSEIGNLVNLRSLAISYNGLTGSIPASINNLTNLTKLDLSYNKLTGSVPNIPGIPVAADVRINNNNFNFDGIESNISRLDMYAPQALIDAALMGPMCAGCIPTHIIPFTGGTIANLTHKLYKDDVLISTVSGVDKVALDGEGIYRVETTNSLVPGLTLVTNNYAVVRLPVTLVSFEGRSESSQTKLTWKTTSETNNKGFEIERSADARTFEKIGFIDGSGDSKEINTYHFSDISPLARSYYRLKQLDHDGKFDYSKIIEVKGDGANVKVYPNPAQEYLTISGIAQKQPFSIIDQNGRVLLKGLAVNKEQIDIKNLGAGRYVVQVGEESSTLMIQK